MSILRRRLRPLDRRKAMRDAYDRETAIQWLVILAAFPLGVMIGRWIAGGL